MSELIDYAGLRMNVENDWAGVLTLDRATALAIISKAEQRDKAVIERDAALSLAHTRHTIIEALTTDLERERAGTDALRKRSEQAEKEIEADRDLMESIADTEVTEETLRESRGELHWRKAIAGIEAGALTRALNALRREP